MDKNYKISTNPYTLSVVKNILKDINIKNIPLFEEKDELLREHISTSIILELSDDIKRLNSMYRAITSDTDIDFGLLKFEELFDILNDFFMNTGDKLISWKKIQSSVLSNPDGMDMTKTLEMIMQNPSLMKMFDTPTENTLEA